MSANQDSTLLQDLVSLAEQAASTALPQPLVACVLSELATTLMEAAHVLLALT